jgi:hypothetical protein
MEQKDKVEKARISQVLLAETKRQKLSDLEVLPKLSNYRDIANKKPREHKFTLY